MLGSDNKEVAKVIRKFKSLHEIAQYYYGGDYTKDDKLIVIFILFWDESRQVHVYMKNNILYHHWNE